MRIDNQIKYPFHYDHTLHLCNYLAESNNWTVTNPEQESQTLTTLLKKTYSQKIQKLRDLLLELEVPKSQYLFKIVKPVKTKIKNYAIPKTLKRLAELEKEVNNVATYATGYFTHNATFTEMTFDYLFPFKVKNWPQYEYINVHTFFEQWDNELKAWFADLLTPNAELCLKHLDKKWDSFAVSVLPEWQDNCRAVLENDKIIETYWLCQVQDEAYQCEQKTSQNHNLYFSDNYLQTYHENYKHVASLTKDELSQLGLLKDKKKAIHKHFGR